MNQTYPFYIKLSCILISIIILGFLAIIGQQILVPMVGIAYCHFADTTLPFYGNKTEISQRLVICIGKCSGSGYYRRRDLYDVNGSG
jgi:hypothetical protein